MNQQQIEITEPKLVRTRITQWRDEGLRSALVPTMGALHDGHLALVAEALSRADKVVVSIFINPKQFSANEDLDSYPRDLAGDLSKLKQAGVDVVYTPTSHIMYPPGFATTINVNGPAMAGLEDAFRPHFFAGVTTVVGKLFIQTGCDIAVFGEKDYQQLMVVKQMARDLDLPIEVTGMATIRETDGLAMSSRNAYLSPEDRAKAPLINQALQDCAAAIRGGMEPNNAAAQQQEHLANAGFKVDYLTLRHAATLDTEIASPPQAPLRLLVAAWLGSTRLIDNIAV